MLHLSSDRNLNLDTSLNVNDDLLNDLGWCIEINETLVDSHLEAIPGLRTFTTGCFSGGNLQGLGGEADWALDLEILGLGALNELLADLLEGSDLSAGESDSDLESFLRGHIRFWH